VQARLLLPTRTFGLGAHDPQPWADVIQHFFFDIPQANGKEPEAWAAPGKLGHPEKEEKMTPG